MADIIRDIVLLTVKEEEIEFIGDGDDANTKKQMKFAAK